MAKDTNKQPGRWAQIFRLYRETIKVDKLALVYSLLGFGAVLAFGLFFAIAGFSQGNIVTGVLFTVMGLVAAVMTAMLLMSRRAEKVAYARIEGQAGAVGAVITSAIRRGWRTSEMPVAVNPRTQDAVYRAVGAAGIVLIAEGSRNTGKLILEEELRKLKRVTPGVTVHVFYVTGDSSGTPLASLAKEVRRLKRTLNRAEVAAVNNRLQSLGSLNIPIPKGIDPRKMRVSRR